MNYCSNIDKKKEYINIFSDLLCSYGYKTPIDDGTDELLEKNFINGKYGSRNMDKIFHLNTHTSDKRYALRYDITLPLSKYVSNLIAGNDEFNEKSIKIYEVGRVWRNEIVSKGRYREFHQLDYEVFNDGSINTDIEIIVIALKFLDLLGVHDC